MKTNVTNQKHFGQIVLFFFQFLFIKLINIINLISLLFMIDIVTITDQ